MKRRWRPNLLDTSNYSGQAERVLDLSRLDGGLNLWDLDYRMAANQSPDMLNMWWKDGSLSSRPGQEYIWDPTDANPYGDFYCCYGKPWHGFWIMHKGAKLYKVDYVTGEHAVIYEGPIPLSPRGSFFVYRNTLYYLNGKTYVKIDSSCTVSEVTGYVPTIVINRRPGAKDQAGGDVYEDENRISAGKKIQFTGDGTSKDYYLPIIGIDDAPVGVDVDGTAYKENSDFTVDREKGLVTFKSAPPATIQNNVTITVYKRNEEAESSIFSGACACVYGSGEASVIVVGGPDAQPNAYFWSGSTALGFDPSYFPFDNYNYAGGNDEHITAFGKQQNMLIIFKERSVGKTLLSTKTLNDLTYINLPYTHINNEIGCDLPGSIQLIENNLVFANTKQGVFIVADTSDANENNILRISRNVNGNPKTGGLLYDLSKVEDAQVTSYDDGSCYWITNGDKAYIWDYTISSYRTKEEHLSWFKFDGIRAKGWFSDGVDHFYARDDGALVIRSPQYADFGEGYTRLYTFAAQSFSTYDRLKDILRVVFSVRSDTDVVINITYKTDHENRNDLTPIRVWGYHVAPRNLSYRKLKVVPFATTAIRKPRCFHVRHFQMTLTNDEAFSDLSIVSAQIIYRYSRGDR